MKTKVCSKCDKRLPIGKFPFADKAHSYRRSDCAACYSKQRAAYGKQYYRRNKKKTIHRNGLWSRKNRNTVRNNKRRWNERNPEKVMLSRVKHRAKTERIPFNIEVSDIEIPKRCPILGIELRKSSSHYPTNNSPSVDRIIPKLGYVKGNVRIISHRANMLRNNATIQEMESIVRDFYDRKS